MPKEADKSKKSLTIQGVRKKTIQTNTYQSSRKAQKVYETKQEHLTVRVPSGSRNKIKDFVENNKDKYKSVNNLILTLIEREMGTKLS